MPFADTNQNANPVQRRAKIVATLGPASNTEPVFRDLVRAGIDVVRLNFSHGTHEEKLALIQMIRKVSREERKPLCILGDLQGPKIRTSKLKDHQPVLLKAGQRLTITPRDVPGTASLVGTTFKTLAENVEQGSHILLSDGLIELRVHEVVGADVVCEVINGGMLGENKGINLPGIPVRVPSLTEKDSLDLEFALKNGVDAIAVSFVRTAEDVRLVRNRVSAYGSETWIIAKLEKPQAIEHLDSILQAADGIMVARGDLAVELSPADVPAAQKQLVSKANEAGKVCIVATQMLESMINHAQPTRAEASDVANAIYDGADVVMLSGETAVGMYPVETVTIMADIIRKAENSQFKYRRIPQGLSDTPETGFAHALARAAHDACDITGADAIIVFTLTGWSARVMSKYRPNAPIFALTPLQATFNQLALYWGITPVISPLKKSTDEMIASGERNLKKAGLVSDGETVLITAGGTAKHKASNMLKIQVIGSMAYR
jgi:pyruvate kinase